MSAYQHPDLVIALHVSGQLSATVQRAQEAAERVGSGVSVIDTGSLSVGAGLIVSELHEVARSESAPSLVDVARSLPSRLHTFALVQDVDALRRSDRSGLLPSSHLARNHPDGARHPRPCRAIGTTRDNAAAPSSNWPDTCDIGPVRTLGPGLSATGTRPTSPRS